MCISNSSNINYSSNYELLLVVRISFSQWLGIHASLLYVPKLNASATTFCRLFSTATFWRPKLARRLFAVLFSAKGRQKVANLFLSSKRMSKRHQKDAKRSATFFGRQRFPSKKVGKTSWHLRSPQVELEVN